MKTYTTKYLPVEGKIELGDNFHHVCDGFLMSASNTDMVEVANRRGHKKVKLFLMDGDIQLGEVSSDVIWVRDGDQFTEDQFAWLHDDGSGKVTPYDEILKDWDEDEEEDRVLVNAIFKIKCSQCNTFH